MKAFNRWLGPHLQASTNQSGPESRMAIFVGLGEEKQNGGKPKPPQNTQEHNSVCVCVCVLQIYTDWANHYLLRSGCPRLISDLSHDVTDGVLLAEIIQIIGIHTHARTHACRHGHTRA